MRRGIKNGAAVTTEQLKQDASPAKVKRTMSPETKAKIAARTKERWAKQKAAKAVEVALPAVAIPTTVVPPVEDEITALVPVTVLPASRESHSRRRFYCSANHLASTDEKSFHWPTVRVSCSQPSRQNTPLNNPGY
jgi:hypothetical protein